MSKNGLRAKHFVKIAEILNQAYRTTARNKHNGDIMIGKITALDGITSELSQYFATENAQFDRQRFKQAVLKGVE